MSNVHPPASLPPDLEEAYRASAEKNVLAALNPRVFFGYFSVCADGRGHGGNTTYPGLDWGQSAEALLWLGRREEVLASWEYVKGFQRGDGLIPFAILPDLAGETILAYGRYPLTASANGAIFEHWVPGNPLRTLANVTALILAERIYAMAGGKDWLSRQADMLRRATNWLLEQVTEDGLVRGGGFYVERPTRLEYDGVNQCYTIHALQLASRLMDELDDTELARRCEETAGRIIACFRRRFWTSDRFVEYIHPEHGPVAAHGFTDVDWAAMATGAANERQKAILWPRIRGDESFRYSGVPTGIATRPETYEDWEMQAIDRHDLAAMGRVWFLECWGRSRMGDPQGIKDSLRLVADVGRRNNWSWRERYYSQRTGDLARTEINAYCEYPANFIRIVHRFLAAP